jgi:hypothetical protein
VELIGYDMSRLVSLFLAAPTRGQLYLPRAMQLLVERYKFAGFPMRVEELTSERVNFKQGLFGDVAIDTLEIYGDGLIVSSKSNSDILDAFLDDLCEWMEGALGLRKIETHAINKAYESHIMVRSEANVLRPLDVLTSARELISDSLKKATGLDVKYEPFGIALSADTSTIASLKPIPFRIERRAGLAFETDYYVSAAPLRTKDHIRVLEKLEALG